MGSKWVWIWWVTIMFAISTEVCLSHQGCWEEERVALLQLTHFFNDPHSLQDWVEIRDVSNANCCKWKKVECDDATGKVSSLDLSNTRNHNSGEWYLNASLFSFFQELNSLDLSQNSIAGFVDNEGLDKLSRLSNLEALGLSMNLFNNDILSSLSALSSLTEIYLDGNRLNETINLEGVNSLYDLRRLNMSNNKISKVISLKGLRNLTELYLSNTNIHDGSSLLRSLAALPSLNMLDLSYNSFSEPTTIQHYMHSFTNLEELYLDGSSLHISFLQSIGASMTSLATLSMRSCQFNGILDFQGLDLSRLSKLKSLDLSDSMVGNAILSPLADLSSLRFLNLNNSGLRGIVDVSGLNSLDDLETLDISNNKIDKFISYKDNRSLKNCPTLLLANVSTHEASGLLQSLDSFPCFSVVYMTHNDFSESTKTQVKYLHNLTNVEELYWDGSSIHISLLHSIAAFTSLRTLTMLQCELIGILDSQDIPDFKNLEALYMDGTSFDMSFFQITRMMTSLLSLTLSNCGLQGTLSYQDGGLLAKFLYQQHDLDSVDLSHNNWTGEFPSWLLDNNKKLTELRLANNSFTGHFQLPNHHRLNLSYLDISKNSFYGPLSNKIGGSLPSLWYLNFSSNNFDGGIPSSIGDMNSLAYLDLSYNQLSGNIPEHLAEGCTSLVFLILSNNSLQGQIFSSRFNMTNLESLALDGNYFTGHIPDSLSNASNLLGLYLSANNLSGRIPSWLGNMSYLEDIVMSNNHLEGPIPSELCQLVNLQILNLANNNISGKLPSYISPVSIKHVHLSRNRLEGQLSDAFYKSYNLVTLDLGYNQLQGSIPTWIGRISKLTYLILRNNNLLGKVPTQLCQLNRLRLLDLSHNNLSERIPHCLDATSLHDHDTTFDDPIYVNNTGMDEKQKGETVEFRTKTISYTYSGKILSYMSGIDLSYNRLTGPIPHQVGNLTRIRSLNFSYNSLTGPIPESFSKLKLIESLDLSYNNLNGTIPPQLVELNYLSLFYVAYNNLFGKIPQGTQFSTFSENSYEGNLFLCGLPLHKSCDANGSASVVPRASADNEEDNNLLDMEVFHMSFSMSYVVAFLGVVAALYINPYWRWSWFHLVETCYYFLVDNLPRGFRH